MDSDERLFVVSWIAWESHACVDNHTSYSLKISSQSSHKLCSFYQSASVLGKISSLNLSPKYSCLIVVLHGRCIRKAIIFPYNMYIRTQPNSLLISIFRMYNKVRNLILPVMWFEEFTRMTEDLAKDVKSALFFKNSIVLPIIFSLILMVSLISIFCVAYKTVKVKNNYNI